MEDNGIGRNCTVISEATTSLSHKFRFLTTLVQLFLNSNMKYPEPDLSEFSFVEVTSLYYIAISILIGMLRVCSGL